MSGKKFEEKKIFTENFSKNENLPDRSREILHRKFSTTAHKIQPCLCLALHLDFGMILESPVGLGIDAVSLLKKF